MRILELNDRGLRLFEGERLLLESAGTATLDGKTLLTGEAALARARLDPRRTNDRFWYQLDAALPAPLGPARTAADLAHAHLASFGDVLTAAPLMIAAPGSFTPAQLGVLLGLLQALGARAVGLVDSAVAAASSVATAARVLHLDLQNHRFVCTWMDGETVLGRTQVDELKPGFATLQDRCATVIAQAFVRHARFDPLHTAATEQALYDQLPGWIGRLAERSSLVLELVIGARTHRVSVAAEALEQALSERVEELADAILPEARARAAVVLLGDRASRVPGLAERLGPVTILDPAAVARGAMEHAERIHSDDPELPWVTRLPRRRPSDANAPAESRATHALIGSRARPVPVAGQTQALASWLAGAPGMLRHDAAGLCLEHASAAVRINGEPAPDLQVLRAGDRIVFGANEVRLIEVE